MEMKLSDATIRTIHVYIDYHEIIDAIRSTIYTSHGIEITRTDKFDFSFIEEGSPSYKTDKIKCVVTKTIDKTPANEQET